MPTIDTTAQLTLTELANRTDPKGNLAVVAEVLSRNNAILHDAPWVEANGTFEHKYTRRLSLPSGSWRRLNEGVATEASQTIPVSEVLGFLETYSEVDKALVDSAPNPQAFRMLEAKAFIEGMSQTLAAALFYSNAGVDPEKITGLAPRLNDTGQDNVMSAGGSGSDTTSIYVVQWGEDKAHLFYPRGAKNFGVQHNDKGQQTLTDANGKKYEGYRDHFEVRVGMAVRDDRCIARLADIETSGSTNTFDEDLLIELLNAMPNDGAGSVIYVNRTIKTQMEIRLKDKANVNFTTDNGLGGVPVLSFKGIPVKKVDAILNTESAID